MADEIENSTGVESEQSKEEKLSAARKKYAQLKKQRQKQNKKNKETTETETDGGGSGADAGEVGAEEDTSEPKQEQEQEASAAAASAGKEEINNQNLSDKLEKEVTNLKSEVEKAKKESENAQKERDALRHEVKSIQEKFDDLQAKSSQVSKSVEETKDKLSYSEEQNMKLKKDIVELTSKREKDVAELQNQLTTSKDRIQQLESDIRKDKASVEAHNNNDDDEETEIFDLVERDRLRSQVAELSDLVSDLRNKLRTKRSSIGPYESIAPESGQIPLGDETSINNNNESGNGRRGSSLFPGSARASLVSQGGNNNRPRNTSFAEVSLFDDSIADSYEQASRRATELRREIGRWVGWQVDLREYFVPPISGLSGVIGPVFQV